MQQRTALTIIALFWLLSIICGGVCGFLLYPKIYPCNESVGTVKIEYIDSFAPNKDTAQKISFVPGKVGTKKYHGNSTMANNTNTMVNLSIDTMVEPESTMAYICLDTNLYKFDTISVDNFRATATVANNEILNMAIEWRNLKPELWKIKRETITVPQKQSLVKVYTGLYGGVAIANKTVASYHGGIGLDAIISDRHLVGLQGGLNSSLQMEFGVRFSEKIRLKK